MFLELPVSKIFVRWLSRSVSLALPLLFGAAMVCGAHPVSASSAPSTALAAPLTASGNDVQVADEVIRALRRLGLNFAPGHIDRPYDPKGELC
jgi:hypothetical protein